MRKLCVAGAAVVLLSFQLVASGSDLVALVDLKFIRDTGEPAAVLCFGDEDDDCGVWATLYLYEAKVRRVISGTESRTTMRVLYGQHALMKKDFRKVLASMVKIEAKDESEPQYRITSWGEKREMVCFPRREGASEGLEVEEGEDSLTCYPSK